MSEPATYDLYDLDADGYGLMGRYPTRAAARSKARRLRAYAIWRGHKLIDHRDPREVGGSSRVNAYLDRLAQTLLKEAGVMGVRHHTNPDGSAVTIDCGPDAWIESGARIGGRVMSYTHRHGDALRMLDQEPPERLRVSPPAAPQLPSYDYWCPECADEVVGETWEQRGVTRLCCERCGGEVLPKDEL
jgi:hypothetical protein